MSETNGRISIRTNAKFFNKQSQEIQNEVPGNINGKWILPIARLFSGSEKYLPGSKVYRDNDGLVYAASYSDSVIETGNMSVGGKFHIAVKELIIEWEDYQAEVAGYIHCGVCVDLMKKSKILNPALKGPGVSTESNEIQNLLTFVKAPGLKTTLTKINKEDLEFFPIDIEQCEVINLVEKIKKYYNAEELETRKEHKLECEIRSLFDENKVLPIRHAHITVEIDVK